MSRIVYVTVLIATLSGGCYLRPAKSTGPLTSAEGVLVVLLGQDCEDHLGAEGDPVSRDLGLKLNVENPTGHVLQLALKGVQLTVEEYTTVPMGADTIETFQPGESREVRLDFLHHSACGRDFALTFEHAFGFRERSVQVAALHFTP